MTDTGPPPSTQASSVPVAFIGLGASAGGLGALRRFFEHTPPDSGAAFIVVMHLSAEHKSQLAELLQTRTRMPVVQVRGEQRIEPNTVYVIPPGRNLSTIDTHLRLSPLEPSRRERAPIDHFFRTLAHEHGERAVAVVLSGTGSDGAVGLSLVKERGGLAVAQDPAEAEYDSMPQSAIMTGLVDAVLPLREMPGEIVRYATSRPNVPLLADDAPLPPSEEELLQGIFAQLRARTHHDFSGYKRSTMMRRTARRMQLRGVEQLGAYLELLRGDPAEADALFSDLLITVTHFFRDAEVFELLAREVVPQLFADKGPGDVLRVWTVGCATGEEAYSLTMLLLEHAAELPSPPEIQVFATDASADSLVRAREGFYPGAIAGDVSEARLKRFFVAEAGGYRVSKELRERVLFAPHNLLSDPPFSKIDLLTCRNVLIYLKREVQGEVLKLFHYALREEGYLLLGTSESVEGAELFRELDKQAHLFGRRNVVAAERHLPKLPFAQPSPLSAALLTPKAPAPRGSYGDLHARMLERYAPPSVLVGADGAIVHLSANAGRYLRDPGGEPTHDLLKRVAPPLRAELRALLYEVSQTSEVARSRPLTLRLGGQLRGLTLRASRAADPEEGVTLLIFDEHEPLTAVTEAARPEDERTVRQLEEELERTRGRLQSVVKEYEASREAMQASNEELRSINEELRSTAEELETSKEELQSINEELITLNQENKHKVEELSRLTSDLQNLFAATDVATLFLDRGGRIKRFTPKVTQLFNILASDLGRPLTHLTHKLGPGAFVDDAQTVLRTLVPIEREVQSDSGTWYLLRLHPYRTADDRIDGVVLTFVEIDQLKRSEAALRASEETYRAIVSQSIVGIAVAAQGGRLTFANRAFGAMLGYGEAELLELTLADITHPDDLPNSAELLERMWREGGAFEVETRYRRRDGSTLWVHSSVAPIYGGEQPRAAVAVALDITQRLEAEADLRTLNTTLERRVQERTAELEASNERLGHSQRRFAQAFQVGPVAACITTLRDERFLEVNDVFSELTGYAPAEVIGKSHRELGMWASAEDQETLQQAGAPHRSFRNLELRIRTKSGDLRDVVLSSEIIRLDGEEGYLKMFYDISERKRTEEQLFRAVQEVMADTNWFSHKILEQLAILKVGGAEPLATVDLSRRERQVLERLAQGLNNDAIGREMGLSVQTVRNYISTIYSKLGVHSRAEAVVWARERGIVGF